MTNTISALLEREIKKKTGLTFKGIPADSKTRTFKHAGKQWFAVNIGDVGVFGCSADNYMCGVCLSGKVTHDQWHWVPEKPLKKSEIDHERQIVTIGNCMQDRGDEMDEETENRYILALGRVIQHERA